MEKKYDHKIFCSTVMCINNQKTKKPETYPYLTSLFLKHLYVNWISNPISRTGRHTFKNSFNIDIGVNKFLSLFLHPEGWVSENFIILLFFH